MSASLIHRIRRKLQRLRADHLPVSVPSRLAPLARQLAAQDAAARASDNWDADTKLARLRLHAHALDKGLHLETFDPNRGQASLKACDALLADPDLRGLSVDPSLDWCREKVAQFRARQAAAAAGTDAGPHGHARSEPMPSSAAAFLRLCAERRSCRAFLERPVDDELMQRLADAARWAPSSCNRQTVRIFATNDPALAAACHATCRGRSGFSAYVPAFASFCVDVRAYAHPEEFTVIYVDGGLAAENFLLAARAEGLGATPMAVGAETPEERRRLRRLLGIPEHYAITVNCSLGHPSRWAEPPVRKPSGDMLKLVRAPAPPVKS